MPTHSNILAWEIPCSEKPGWLQSMGSQRVRHNLAAKQQQQILFKPGRRGVQFVCLYLNISEHTENTSLTIFTVLCFYNLTFQSCLPLSLFFPSESFFPLFSTCHAPSLVVSNLKLLCKNLKKKKKKQ